MPKTIHFYAGAHHFRAESSTSKGGTWGEELTSTLERIVFEQISANKRPIIAHIRPNI